MDRVELLFRLGPSIPELGSVEDHTLREFLIHDRNRRVLKAKLDAYLNITEINQESVKKAMKSYVDAEFRITDLYTTDIDLKLMEEFEEMKNVNLTLSLDKDGGLQLSGLH